MDKYKQEKEKHYFVISHRLFKRINSHRIHQIIPILTFVSFVKNESILSYISGDSIINNTD